MTFENPFRCPGQWLKGNLHTHSTLSDGAQSPQERVDAYEGRGYDFLALTDHEVVADVAALVSRTLLLIRGIEVTCTNPTGGPGFHIVGIDVPADFLPPPSKHLQPTIDGINDAGGLAVVAHPYWCGQTAADLAIVDDAIGLEVFNTTCLRSIGKGTSAVHWDGLLAQGKRLFGLAVDDAHRVTRDAFQGWVMVKAAERTADAVVDALSLGRFYASCGPTIEDMAIDGDRLAVRTSPVASISFISRHARGGYAFKEDGGCITEAEYALSRCEGYVRVECTDAAGRQAWANPITLD